MHRGVWGTGVLRYETIRFRVRKEGLLLLWGELVERLSGVSRVRDGNSLAVLALALLSLRLMELRLGLNLRRSMRLSVLSMMRLRLQRSLRLGM